MCSRTPRKPERLRRGKAFHKKIQKDWEKTAEGHVSVEETVSKSAGRDSGKGRMGRIDLHVDDSDVAAVVEIKHSDWDRMTMAALRRNVRRQIRQIWQYIESQLHPTDPTIRPKDVSPGVVFPKRPRSKQRMRLIEMMFEEEGIPVVWDDESVVERKERTDET